MAEDAEQDFQSLLESEEKSPPVERGKVLSGRVAALDAQGMIVDLGLKRDGLVPRAELDKLLQEGADYQVGHNLTVVVSDPEDHDGNLLVSVKQGRHHQDWQNAEQLLASGQVWEGEVVGHNQGGLIIQFGGVQAFTPASQIADLPRNLSDAERQQRLEAMVGRRLGFKVIEVNRRRRRLVLSQRQAQREYRDQQRTHLLQELREGVVRKGVVTALRDFGAFIDLGGADGLVHISEIAWHRLKHPGEVLRVGQEVEVEVLRIDPDSKRIGLSIKRRQPTPWSRVGEMFQQGQTVDGVITRITHFGAFVDLGQGIEGLLHISQWGGRADLAESQLVRVNILRIEPERQRVSLGMAQPERGTPGRDVPARALDEEVEVGE